MEVDLQNCGTLFSLLPSDRKSLQKYVESLFGSPLVCNEFYALYFLSSGFFYCFTFFSSVCMAGEFEHHGVSSPARHSDLLYTSILRFAF